MTDPQRTPEPSRHPDPNRTDGVTEVSRTWSYTPPGPSADLDLHVLISFLSANPVGEENAYPSTADHQPYTCNGTEKTDYGRGDPGPTGTSL